MPLVIALVLALLLPIAWFISEFQEKRSVRVCLGMIAIAISYLIAWAVGSVEQFNCNAWYGVASKDLIDNTVTELQEGNVDDVVTQLKVLSDKLQPTYENKADFDRLVAEYVYAISDSPVLRERNDPRWADNVPESHRKWAEEQKERD